MWTVLLDSTVVVSDFRLRSAAVQGLFARAKSGQLRIVVPEVVIREAVVRFEQSLAELAAVERKTGTLAGRLGVDRPDHCLDPAAEVTRYEVELRDTLRDAGADVPPPAPTPHLDLMERAARKIKPFKASGAGYRDALIWETALAYARGGEVALVTANHLDFAETSDEVALVAAGLRSDLFRIGEEYDRVIVCRTLATAIEYLFAADERLAEELNASPPASAQDLIDLLPGVLPVAEDPALGLPRDAAILEARPTLSPSGVKRRPGTGSRRSWRHGSEPPR